MRGLTFFRLTNIDIDAKKIKAVSIGVSNMFVLIILSKLFYHTKSFQLPGQYSYLKYLDQSQSSFTCSKVTIETLEQGAKFVQS